MLKNILSPLKKLPTGYYRLTLVGWLLIPLLILFLLKPFRRFEQFLFAITLLPVAYYLLARMMVWVWEGFHEPLSGTLREEWEEGTYYIYEVTRIDADNRGFTAKRKNNEEEHFTKATFQELLGNNDIRLRSGLLFPPHGIQEEDMVITKKYFWFKVKAYQEKSKTLEELLVLS